MVSPFFVTPPLSRLDGGGQMSLVIRKVDGALQSDAECDLDYVPNEARNVSDVEIALSNSFGMGGNNAVLAFKRYNAV